MVRSTSPSPVREEEEGDRGVSEVPDGRIFTIQGRPARFFLYTSGFGALTEGQVEGLTEQVQAHGGILVNREQDADTIIVRPVGVDILRQKYWDSRTVWVEEITFVRKCILKKQYAQLRHKPARKGMGGRTYPTGRRRAEFTPEDDRNLCEYLAMVAPYKEDGGRLGQAIYKRLVKSAEDFEERQWARRHTMHSWRERYKNRQEFMDYMIDHLVEENPPSEDGKGLYELNRRFSGKQRLVRLEVDEEEEEEENVDVPPDHQEEHFQQNDDIEAQKRRNARLREEEHVPAPLAKKARHTDVASRRDPSPMEQGRGERGRSGRRVTYPTFSGKSRGSLRLDESDEGDEVHGDIELDEGQGLRLVHLSPFNDDNRPGPEDAGLSLSQRSPSPPQRFSYGHARQSQAPVSSQMTLVGSQAVPSGVSLRRNNTRINAQSSASTRPRSDLREEEENEEGQDAEDGPLPQNGLGETYEDEVDVEDMLSIRDIDNDNAGSRSPSPAAGSEADGDATHPFEEDSDDAQIRNRLFGGSPSNGSLQSKILSPSREPAQAESSDSDSEPFEITLPPTHRNSGSRTPRSTDKHARKASGGQRVFSSQNAEYTDDTDTVPLSGTRAREVKTQRVEELKRSPYAPPEGTRAATLTLRNRAVLRA